MTMPLTMSKTRWLLVLGVWAAARGAWAAPPAAAGARPKVLAAASGESAGGAAEPATPPPAAAPATDLAKLRADYDRLRDELYRARARAELVEEGLYASKLAAELRWKGAPDFVLRRAEIRLDGNSVWDSGDKPMVDERIKVAERPIKPGQHALTVRLEVRPGKKSDKETQDLGYSSEQTFVINVPDAKRTTVELTADDDGDLPGYEPEMEVELESEK
jgi:hypothetical protein